ncbi:hypothetical protein PTKIN_Ptkin01aG0248200 [Pterospermum kingtungense]
MQDCAQLAELNVFYLEKVSAELKSAGWMTDELVDRVSSLLSGVVTNQHTCFDGLADAKSSFATTVLGEPLVNVTRLYSVSLGLVTHALDRNLKRFKGINNGSQNPSPLKNGVGQPLNSLVQEQISFHRECDIYGTVDFIFGNAAAVFQNCNLYLRKPMRKQKNAITAQGRTDPNQKTGISIQNCTIEAAPDLASDLSTTLNYLGRPWKNYSRTVFMHSYIGDLISPSGWLEWNGTFALDTLYYGEFENHGPGADTSMRDKWPGYSLLNATQAMEFTVNNFTKGDTWLHKTGTAFSGGL